MSSYAPLFDDLGRKLFAGDEYVRSEKKGPSTDNMSGREDKPLAEIDTISDEGLSERPKVLYAGGVNSQKIA